MNGGPYSYGQYHGELNSVFNNGRDSLDAENKKVTIWGEIVRTTDDYAARGLIDPLTNLSNKPVWISTGTKDSTVNPEITTMQKEFYEKYESNVFFQEDF